MADIFFSYCREDLERILPIVRALEAKGFTIFLDRTIPAAKSWHEVISDELETARCVMVAWPETSIRSGFVIEEADYGKQHSALTPLLLNPVKPPFGFGAIQAADLTDWDGSDQAESFRELYRDILEHLGPPKPMETRETETLTESTTTSVSRSEMDSTSSSGPGEGDSQIEKMSDIQCRLPRETEWEDAARAGTTTEFALLAPDGSNSIEDKALANCDGCGSQWDSSQTSPVGSFGPND